MLKPRAAAVVNDTRGVGNEDRLVECIRQALPSRHLAITKPYRPPHAIPTPHATRWAIQMTVTFTRSCARCWACSLKALQQAAPLPASAAQDPRQHRPASRWACQQFAVAERVGSNSLRNQRTWGPSFHTGQMATVATPALCHPPNATAAQAAAAQAPAAPAVALEPRSRERACRGAPLAPAGTQGWALWACIDGPRSNFNSTCATVSPALPLGAQLAPAPQTPVPAQACTLILRPLPLARPLQPSRQTLHASQPWPPRPCMHPAATRGHPWRSILRWAPCSYPLQLWPARRRRYCRQASAARPWCGRSRCRLRCGGTCRPRRRRPWAGRRRRCRWARRPGRVPRCGPRRSRQGSTPSCTASSTSTPSCSSRWAARHEGPAAAWQCVGGARPALLSLPKPAHTLTPVASALMPRLLSPMPAAAEACFPP